MAGKDELCESRGRAILGFSIEEVMGVSVTRYLKEIQWDRILDLDEAE